MAAPARPLTDRKCTMAAYSPGGKNKLFDGGGLYLELQPSGSKLWRHKYARPDGRENRLSYGPYPEVGLLAARERRDASRALLREGKDPALEIEQTKAKTIAAASNTFQAVGMEWFDNYRERWVDRHAQNILSRLVNDVFPSIGHLPVASVDRATVLQTVRKIEQRGARDIAKRVTQYCAQIFDYAIATDRGLANNPAQGVTRLLKPYKKGHFARIDPRELPAFLHKLETAGSLIRRETLIATKLLMLTMVRTAELIGAQWVEFDFENSEWTIPAPRMKMKDRPPFVVPLSRQAIALLKELKELTGRGPYVFQHNSNSKKHMSNCTVLAGIQRIGYKGVMTGHGFRSLGADTLHAVLDHPKDIVDKCLAHQEQNKVASAYFRDPLLEQRRILMQDLADFVDYCAMLAQTPENLKEPHKIERLLREYAAQKQPHLKLVRS